MIKYIVWFFRQYLHFNIVLRGEDLLWLTSVFLLSTALPHWLGTSGTQYTSISLRPGCRRVASSHLGPLLFLLLIINIITIVPFGKMLWFADYLEMFSTIKTTYKVSLLQSNLFNTTHCCSINKLHKNVAKFYYGGFTGLLLSLLLPLGSSEGRHGSWDCFYNWLFV